MAGGLERQWLEPQLEVQVQGEQDVVMVVGARASRFGGLQCILGVRILAALLDKWERGGPQSYSNRAWYLSAKIAPKEHR